MEASLCEVLMIKLVCLIHFNVMSSFYFYSDFPPRNTLPSPPLVLRPTHVLLVTFIQKFAERDTVTQKMPFHQLIHVKY